MSGSEWEGADEWADESTPSLYGYFNGPGSPGNSMRFFVNATVVPSVSIDVLPGDPANKIYPNKIGKFPVAVLSGPTFDAVQVDLGTVKLGLGEAAPAEAPIVRFERQL